MPTPTATRPPTRRARRVPEWRPPAELVTGYVDERDVAAMVGKTVRQIRALVEQREAAAEVQPWHIPAPEGVGRWRQRAIYLWGLSVGLIDWRGHRVIGYAGISQRTGLRDQTLRAYKAGRKLRTDFPAPVVVVVGRAKMPLFPIDDTTNEDGMVEAIGADTWIANTDNDHRRAAVGR